MIISDLVADFLNSFFDDLINMEERTGVRGERLIYNILKEGHNEKHILRNVYLKKENNEYTEIDSILLDKKGIFVIESKDLSGWIYGNEKQAQWTQCLYYENYKFYNPIWQNNTHIKSLKHNLKNYPNINYFSIIVFGDKCALKKFPLSTPNTYIIHRYQLKYFLNHIEKHLQNSITENDIKEILKILKTPPKDKNVKDIHISTIKKNLQNNATCPKCKSKLIKRKNGKTGQIFYGCENYPSCKFTKDIL